MTEPFVPSSEEDLETGTSVSEGAKAAAESIVKRMAGGTTTAVEEPLSGEEGEEHVSAEKEEVVEGVEEEEGAEEVEGEDSYSEVLAKLSELGVDLGVDPSSLPPEVLPAFNQLASTAVEAARKVIEEQIELNRQLEEVKQFREKLEKNPDRLLLTLAVTHPDVFKKVAEYVNEMEQDPRIKESVIREINAEARLMEAERRERAMLEAQVLTKARQITAETRKQAARYGVSPKIAEQVVASVITNVGDIDLEDVEEIVKEIAPVKKPIKKQKVVSKPQPKTAPAAMAPHAKVEGALGGSPPPKGASLRDIIGGAIARIGGGKVT